MLSAVSGLVFADLTGREPVIDWRDGSYAPLGENAYPLLFDSPIGLQAEAFDGAGDGVDPPIWAGLLDQTPQAMVNRFAPDRHRSATVYRRFCTDMSRRDQPAPVAVFWCYLPKFGRLAPLMRRDPRFRGRRLDAVIADYLDRYFTPNARVRDAVAAMRAQFARPVIGVHVRYTDRKIPLAPLKRALRRRLAGMPGATIFLATDNGRISGRIRRRIRQSALHRQAPAPRRDPAASALGPGEHHPRGRERADRHASSGRQRPPDLF